MALSPRLRYKLDRMREQFSGLFGGEREASASEAVSIVRHAGRSERHEMPPMRREHEFRHGRRQPLAQPAIPDHFAGDLRNPKLELSAIRREPCSDDSGQRISSAWRRLVWHLQFWSYQWRSLAKVRRVAALAN